MRVAILANPRSGRGTGENRARAVASALEARGHEVASHVGRDRDGAMHWLDAHGRSCDRLVVLGGDGSLNAAINALGGTLPPTALLPLGTANLLGKELRLPRDPDRVVALVEGERIQEIDLGRINGQFTFLVWDFGLGGELMRRFEETRSGAIRKIDYVPHVWSLLRDPSVLPEQEVWADGESLGGFVFGVVANVRSYATSWLRLGPGDYDDGEWELYLFDRVGFLRLMEIGLASLFRRVHRCRHCLHRRVKAVTVSGSTPAPLQVDGDYAGSTPVEFEVGPFRLPLLIPSR